MDFNIPHPEERYLSDAIGITPERLEELDRAHEELWKSYGPDGCLARWHHVLADIANLCHSVEEFGYCMVIHCATLQHLGRKIA